MKKKSAFTLIELLVVIAIILILASLLNMGLQGARASAKRLQCMSNVRSLGMAAIIQAENNRGKFATSVDTTKTLTQENCFGLLYDALNFNDMSVFVCPMKMRTTPLPAPSAAPDANGEYTISTNAANISYHFVLSEVAAQMQTTSHPGTNIVLIEAFTGTSGTSGAYASADNHQTEGGSCFRINGKAEFIGKGGAAIPQNKAKNGTTPYSITSGTGGNLTS